MLRGFVQPEFLDCRRAVLRRAHRHRADGLVVLHHQEAARGLPVRCEPDARLQPARRLGPKLLVQRGQLVGQVRGVGGVDHADTVAVRLQLGDGGVLAVTGPVGLRDGKAVQRAHQQPQRHAVAEQRHGVVRVRRDDIVQRREHPLAHLLHGLRAVGAPVGGVGVEVQHLRAVELREVRPGTVLPHADAHLPQPRLQAQLQPVRAGDRQRGGLRAR